jgi:hypothetical protein
MDRVSVTKLEVGQRLSHKDMETQKESRRKENTSRERTLKKGSKMVKRKRRDNKHQKFYEHMTWTQ